MKRVSRADLVVGVEYYYDKSREEIGRFIKRGESSLFFKNVSPSSSYRSNKDGLVEFYLDIDGGFEEVNPVKDLDYWRENAEEDYIRVPISVLRYITELEARLEYNQVDYTSCEEGSDN